MKKITLLLLALFCLTISCNKEEFPNEFNQKAEFENLSKLHNQAMDYILNEIQTKNNAETLSSKEILECIKIYSSDFIDNNCLNVNNEIDQISILNNECARLMEFRNLDFQKSDYLENDFLIFTIDTYSNYLSNEQIEILLEINEIINPENTIEEITQKLSYIKDIKSLDLPYEQRSVIYAATTIGLESIKYWNENADKWGMALTNNLTQKDLSMMKGWFNWNQCGKFDIAGGIGGAIAGGLVGAVAGGVGAVPGAAAGFVGGSIGTSVTDAVYQLLEHLI